MGGKRGTREGTLGDLFKRLHTAPQSEIQTSFEMVGPEQAHREADDEGYGDYLPKRCLTCAGIEKASLQAEIDTIELEENLRNG